MNCKKNIGTWNFRRFNFNSFFSPQVFSIEDIDEKILNLRQQLSSLARNNSSDMSEDEDNSWHGVDS